MAIKVWDGFDHYNNVNDLAARSGFLQIDPDTAFGFAFPTGRNGQQRCLAMGGTTSQENIISFVYAQRVASAFTGFAFFMPTGVGPLTFEFWDSVTLTCQISFMFRADNQTITVFRGNAGIATTKIGGDGGPIGTILGITNNNAFSQSSWNFLEFWPVIDNTTGSVKAYINNVEVIWVSGPITGVDTQVSANAWWDVMHIQTGIILVETLLMDDLYYGDTTTGAGTHPGNVPLGDCHTETLFALGNNTVQWTPLTSTNYVEVQEHSMDSDTSYNFSNTVGQEDLLNFDAMSSSANTIYGIQLTGAYRKDDAGGRQIKQALKSGATEVYGASNALGELNYVYFTDQWILNPDTGSNWTTVGVNGLSAGYNVSV